MSLDKMQQDHALYLAATKKESERVIEAIRSQCNATTQRNFESGINNAFNQSLAEIQKTRTDFEQQLQECKNNAIDDPEYYQEDLESIKRTAINILGSNYHESTLKKIEKQSGINISQMLQFIDKFKQETRDFINSAQ